MKLLMNQLSLSDATYSLANYSSLFYFSTTTLILGIVGGLYLFIDWLYHRRQHKFALLWSIGLFALYWFQVPAILASSGASFTLTDFNRFFSVAFPTAFIGAVLIYAGILSVLKPPNQKKISRYLLLWAILALAVFALYFRQTTTITTYIPLFATLFLFFLPIHILIVLVAWRWSRRKDWPKTKICSFGIALIIGSFLLAIVQDLFALYKGFSFPPEFWFLAIANSPALFFMQATGTILLLAGFFFVHRNCCGVLDGRVSS